MYEDNLFLETNVLQNKKKRSVLVRYEDMLSVAFNFKKFSSLVLLKLFININLSLKISITIITSF